MTLPLFLFAATLARLASSLLPLGLFFVAADLEGHGAASLAAASAFSLGHGFAQWPSGRLLDRVGRWRGLRASCWASAAASLVFAATADGSWHWVMAAVTGIMMAPAVVVPRALLIDVVGAENLTAASGREAASYELALIAAPVVAVVLASFGVAGIGFSSAALSAGAALLLRPRGLVPGPEPASGARPVARPVHGVVGIAAGALLLGISGGLLEPGLAVVADEQLAHLGALWKSVPFIMIAVGSLSGGVLAGRQRWPSRGRHAIPLLLWHGAALIGCGIIPWPAAVAVLLLAGVAIAPLNSLAALLAERRLASDAVGEGFALIAASMVVGSGIGQAIAARVIGSRPPEHLLILAAAPPLFLALAVFAVGRRTRPRSGALPECGTEGSTRCDRS